MTVEKKVYRNSFIYTACNFALKAMNFLLLPLYTAFLTTADYGVTGLMDRFVSVATVLSTFSLQAAIMRFYVDFREDEEGLSRFCGTLVCFSVLSTLVFDTVFFTLRGVLVPMLFRGVSFMPTVAITLSGLAFTNVYGIYQQVLRGMERARESALTSIVYLSLNVAFTILFVAGFGWGANGSLLGTALAGVCLSSFAVWRMISLGTFRLCIDWHLVRELLAYSIPLMPHNLATQIAQLVSGVLINNGGSLAAVGLYNVASKFGAACDTLQNSVSTAYSPWLYRMLADRTEGYKQQLGHFTRTLLDVYLLVFVGISYFVREPILLMLNPSYAESWMLVPLIALVYAVKSAYYFYIGILFYYKEAANRIFIATLTSSMLNVIMSLPLVAWWGSYGSVLADGISMFVRVAMVVHMTRRYEDVGYRISTFAKSFLLVATFVTVGLAPCMTAPLDVVWWTVAWRIALFALLVTYVLRKHPGIVAAVCARFGVDSSTESGRG